MNPLMSLKISILPSGHLHCADDLSANKIAAAFKNDVGEGLFPLASSRDSSVFSNSAHFWRDFACSYMSERCHMPKLETAKAFALEPIPWNSESQSVLLTAPPMHGAEYLTRTSIRTSLEFVR